MGSDWFELVMKVVVVLGSVGLIGAAGNVVNNWAKRVGQGPAPADGGKLQGELAELHEQVQRLSGEVEQLQERVDFAERMLARERDPERLKG